MVGRAGSTKNCFLNQQFAVRGKREVRHGRGKILTRTEGRAAWDFVLFGGVLKRPGGRVFAGWGAEEAGQRRLCGVVFSGSMWQLWFSCTRKSIGLNIPSFAKGGAEEGIRKACLTRLERVGCANPTLQGGFGQRSLHALRLESIYSARDSWRHIETFRPQRPLSGFPSVRAQRSDFYAALVKWSAATIRSLSNRQGG